MKPRFSMEPSPLNPFKDDMTGRLLLGRYRTVRRLAAGGMGVVYLARSEGAEGFVTPVVVKLMLPNLSSDDDFLGMFIREAKILANLDDPGIVRVIDFAMEDNLYIIVLEYVRGFQLREWNKYLKLKNIQLPTDVILQIAINVLESLEHAHTIARPDGTKLEIVHRDISPSNILVDTDGRTKIVDFGIARMNESTDGYKTQSGSFKGKLSYSAPERFANYPATPQSDVYSVGVTLHETLIGKNEFHTNSHASTIANVLHHSVSSVLAKRPDAPPQLDGIIAKALAKDPIERYHSAEEFAAALREIRRNDERTVKEKLTALARYHFSDEMAASLGIESLGSREQAWRSPSILPEPTTVDTPLMDETTEPQSITIAMPGRAKESTRPVYREKEVHGTSSDSPGQAMPPPSTKEMYFRARTIVILGLLVVAGIGVFVGYLLLASTDAAERKVVVIQSPTQSVEEKPHSPATTGFSKTGANSYEPSKSSTTHIGSSPSIEDDETQLIKALTQSFNKHSAAIDNCFKGHPNVLKSESKILVHFSISSSGEVQKTYIQPRAINSTPLGQCIVTIAKQTYFPPQDAPISFSIPLRITR